MSSILSEIILIRNKDVAANLLLDYYDRGTSLLDFFKILKFVRKTIYVVKLLRPIKHQAVVYHNVIYTSTFLDFIKL